MALRELHASHIGEKTEAIGEIPACRGGGRRTSIGVGPIRAQSFSNMENEMKRLITLALAAVIAAPSAVEAQPATSVAMNCDTGTFTAGGEAPNLHGLWDFLMVPRGTPSFGLMSIGFVADDYGGSLVPVRTAPVVLRKITLTGNSIQMVVASTEGDVLFDGRLSAKGDLMCGTVTYHGGEAFPMMAQKRPSTYQLQSQAERAR